MAVVVAVDGSASSWEAIRLAAREASSRQADLIAVAAYSADRAIGAPAGRPVTTLWTAQEEQAAAESALRNYVREALGDQADAVELRVEPGLAGHVIVEVAQHAHAELIVLAARSGISLLPGTVSQYVLRHARCPVLVVPADRHAG